MKVDEIALLQRTLWVYRMIETEPSGGRSAKAGETRAANMLEKADAETVEILNQLLARQGGVLSRYTHMEMPGIRDVAYCLVFVGAQDGGPELLSSEKMFEALKQRRAFAENSNKEWLASWWFFLWMIAMGQLYRKRHWNEISPFSESFISRDAFIEEVDHVLARAQQAVLDGSGTWLCKVLVGVDGHGRPNPTKLAARCSAFLDTLVDTGWIEEIEPKLQYRQTLLGAVDLATKMEREFAPVFPAADVLTQSAAILLKTEAPTNELADGAEETADVGD